MTYPNHTNLLTLRRLRAAALVEGATLLLLVGIAVPLKHLAGLPSAVSVVGPIHGMVFLSYLWMVFNTVSGQSWTGREIGGMLGGALVPFGALFTVSLLNRKLSLLATQEPGNTGGSAS